MENDRPVRSKYLYNPDTDRILWLPDDAIPYVIHWQDQPDHPGMTAIWPEVHRTDKPHGLFRKYTDIFHFTTNRNHGFTGRLLEQNGTEILFRCDADPTGSSLLRICPMTDEEFAAEQTRYRKCGHKPPETKEDLVRIFMSDLAW